MFPASANVPVCSNFYAVTASPFVSNSWMPCPPAKPKPNPVLVRDKQRLTDLLTIQSALARYEIDHNLYPIGNGISLGTANYACLNAVGWMPLNCAFPYLNPVPDDPLVSGLYVYTMSTSSYRVTAVLEGTINGLGPGAIHLTPQGIFNGP
jgi:hypothetical protein